MTNASSQSVIDAVSSEGVEPELITEKIKLISESKRIFVISNNNEKFSKGDFITILQSKKPTARALVAKIENNNVGIKITKIYSLSQWGMISKGKEIQIIIGDDSYFSNASKKKEPSNTAENNQKNTEGPLLNNGESKSLASSIEDDLAEVGLDESDSEIKDKGNRAIRPDNLFGGDYGRINAVDSGGTTTTYTMWSLAWAYQAIDNLWIEGVYSNAKMNNFPTTGIETSVQKVTGRLKYTFEAPFYSYIQPYIGFQGTSVQSPDAGVDNGSIDPDQIEAEKKSVDALKKQGPIAGVTLLKRLVPGWFARADIGTDYTGVGFAIEF